MEDPNVCLIDSVGSQANRIEPCSSGQVQAPRAADRHQAAEKEGTSLEAGHRAAMRCFVSPRYRMNYRKRFVRTGRRLRAAGENRANLAWSV
jgi:hypothetical protein